VIRKGHGLGRAAKARRRLRFRRCASSLGSRSNSSYRAGAGCGLVDGAVVGLEKFTLGATRDPSEAWK